MSFSTTERMTELQRVESHEHARVARILESVKVELVPGREPRDVRLLGWVYRQIVTPRRIVRFLVWIVNPMRLVRARIALAAILGPRVSEEEYRDRQSICKVCEKRDGDYCRACRCPRWRLSRLGRKNRMARHYCPHKRHSGQYPGWKLPYICPGCGGNGQADTNRKSEVSSDG